MHAFGHPSGTSPVLLSSLQRQGVLPSLSSMHASEDGTAGRIEVAQSLMSPGIGVAGGEVGGEGHVDVAATRRAHSADHPDTHL